MAVAGLGVDDKRHCRTTCLLRGEGEGENQKHHCGCLATEKCPPIFCRPMSSESPCLVQRGLDSGKTSLR